MFIVNTMGVDDLATQGAELYWNIQVSAREGLYA